MFLFILFVSIYMCQPFRLNPIGMPYCMLQLHFGTVDLIAYESYTHKCNIIIIILILPPMTCCNIYIYIYLVKVVEFVYTNHSWDQQKVATIDRWPLYGGP